MITEFSLTVTIVTVNRKEVELLQSSAGPSFPLTESRITDYNLQKTMRVCVCVLNITNPDFLSCVVVVMVSCYHHVLDSIQSLIDPIRLSEAV